MGCGPHLPHYLILSGWVQSHSFTHSCKYHLQLLLGFFGRVYSQVVTESYSSQIPKYLLSEPTEKVCQSLSLIAFLEDSTLSHQDYALKSYVWDFSDSSVDKESACNAADPSSIPGLGRSAGKGKRLPTLVFWPGEPQSMGCKESDRTEWLSLSL